MNIPEERHPSTRHFAPHFRYAHLPPHLQAISKPIHDVAQQMVDMLPDGPELTEGLRKLWEAKNSLVVHAGFCQGQNAAPALLSGAPTPGLRCPHCASDLDVTLHIDKDRRTTRCGQCHQVCTLA